MTSERPGALSARSILEPFDQGELRDCGGTVARLKGEGPVSITGPVLPESIRAARNRAACPESDGETPDGQGLLLDDADGRPAGRPVITFELKRAAQ